TTALSASERARTGPVPTARYLRRQISLRREQAWTKAGRWPPVLDGHAAGSRAHVARQLAMGGDAQPRRPRHDVAGQVHGGAERRMAGGVSVEGVRWRELRLAVLLLQQRGEKARHQSGVRRRRQEERPLRRVQSADGRVSRSLGAERRALLHRNAVSESIPGRRV